MLPTALAGWLEEKTVLVDFPFPEALFPAVFNFFLRTCPKLRADDGPLVEAEGIELVDAGRGV